MAWRLPFSSRAHDHHSLFNMCVHKHISAAEATVWLFSSDSSPRPRLQQAVEPLFRLAPQYKALCVLWGRVWLVTQILALAAERPPLRDRVRGCCDQLVDCGFQWQRFTPTAPPLMLPLLLVRSHKKRPRIQFKKANLCVRLALFEAFIRTTGWYVYCSSWQDPQSLMNSAGWISFFHSVPTAAWKMLADEALRLLMHVYGHDSSNQEPHYPFF